MIITRLILHRRNIREAIGASAGVGGLYTAIVTMLIESCSLYAAAYVMCLGLWIADNAMVLVFAKVLDTAQVCTAFRSIPQFYEILGYCYLIVMICRSSLRF
jgi:hypothetical protein